MKNFRLFAASLIVAAVVTFASGQQSDDITALRAKAEKGNGLAQYNLGLAYAEGHGVPADQSSRLLCGCHSPAKAAPVAVPSTVLIASFDKRFA